jgi:flagellar motor component MotA
VDKSSIGGVVIAVGGIVSGLMMEGGSISQLLQPTAALIVLGGTLGAVMVQYWTRRSRWSRSLRARRRTESPPSSS